MTYPLDQSIDRIRSAARRIALGYGLGLTLAALAGGLVLVGLLDYYLRVEWVPLRILLSLAVVLVTAVAVVRFLAPALRMRPTEVAVAQRLQDRFPELGDKLASAVEFLHQPEQSDTAGSATLRRAVIVEAETDVQKLNLRDVLDSRPMQKALLAAGAGMFILCAIGLAWPDLAEIGLSRIANPLGSTQWPRKNKLVFVQSDKPLAAGQMFEALLVDAHGSMPDEVQIEYRLGADAGGRITREPMRRLDARMTATRENVQRSFSYRAFGGDDHTMGWIEQTVVEPAKLESLSVTIEPPAYTGWPTETSTGVVAALVGTRLEVRGRASKPLSAVALKFNNGTRVEGRLEKDEQTFVVPVPDSDPLLVKDTGSYCIELTDKEGVTAGADRQFAVRAVPDEPPAVALEKPNGDLYLTPQATVPISVLVKDRLAIKSVDLHYTRSDKSDAGAHTISLYVGPEKVPATDKTGLALAAIEPERKLIEHELNLADLKLTPGTQLAIHATASDYQPAVGQSPAVRVFIITPRELEERLARQQAQVLGDLARALKLEREARARVTELEIQMQQVGQLNKGDLDQLQAAELQQRDVRRMLTGGAEAARNQVARVEEQLANNKLNSPEIQRRMGALGGMLDALEKKQLPDAERELTAALKNAQLGQDQASGGRKPPVNGGDEQNSSGKNGAEAKEATPQAKETDRALASARHQQDQVIDSLDKAISELKRWDKYREYSRDLSDIEKRQQQAREQTADLLSKTLGRDTKDLAPQEVADLKKQAEKQAELAREFNKVVEGMQKTRSELEQSDPLVAQSLEDAVAQAGEKGVAQKMASAASQIDQNQVAGAVRQQAEANQGLQEMLDVLSNRREQELSRLVQKLREAEQKLTELRKKQSELRKKMQQEAKKPDSEERRREMQRLSREQQELQKEALRLARQLQRLDARKPADKLVGAGARMSKSGQQGQEGQAQQADNEAAAAEKDLEQAQQQLAQERQQAEIDLVEEQLVRLKDQLQGLQEQQQAFLDETKRLEGLRDRQRKLTRGQEVSVSNLARNQAGLSSDVALAARKLAAAEGFGLALERASTDMSRAATSLSRLNTGDEPQRAQRRALGRLKLVLDALQPDKPDNDMEDPGSNGQQQPGAQQQPQQQPAGDGIHTLQELKLLKLMQQDVRERTDSIEARKRSGELLADDELRELGDLAEEQGRLADLMLKLREPKAPAPEDNPDKLPGGNPADDMQNEKGEPGEGDGAQPPANNKEEPQTVEPLGGSEGT